MASSCVAGQPNCEYVELKCDLEMRYRVGSSLKSSQLDSSQGTVQHPERGIFIAVTTDDLPQQ